MTPTLAGGFFTTEPAGRPRFKVPRGYVCTRGACTQERGNEIDLVGDIC